MSDVLESLMIICFGISWPLNIVKAWKSRTTKGISLPFYLFVWFGYIFGIVNKIISAANGTYQYNYVLIFYIVNILMVSMGIIIYIRNSRIDALPTKDMR